MSRNGSGTYSLPAGNPVVSGTVISSSWANTTLADIATALTQSIAKDGQTTPTANLPMGTYKHTNVAVASALTDYARADQVQNSAFEYLTSVSGADTITAAASPVPAAYAAGQTFKFVSVGANTGAVTLNISSLGAKDVTKNGTTALAAGDIPNGALVEVVYDGTRFQLINVKITALTVPTGIAKGDGSTFSAAVAGTDYVAPGATTTSGLTMATSRLLGRTTASTGAIEEISVGTGLTFSAGSLSATNAGITLGTPVASTSGTSIDFTSIPAGTKRIVVSFAGVSGSGTSQFLIQIGDSGGIENTGYVSGAGITVATSTAGFILVQATAAAEAHQGSVILSLENSTNNTWVSIGNIYSPTSARLSGSAGYKSLSATLDRVRITTVSGTDTFDAGEINIQYE